VSTPTSASDAEALIDNIDNKGFMFRVQGALHRFPWLSPLLVLIIAMIVFTLLNNRFLLPANLSLIMQQVSIVGAIAVAQTLIILTAGIDLSVGAIAVLSSMVMAKTAFDQGVPGPLALIIGLIVGTAAGALNGFLVTRLKLPPFIVTLGTLGIFTALTLIYATGRTVQSTELAPILKVMGNVIKLGPFTITWGVIMMILLYVIFAYVLRNTAWGKHVYAVGDDPQAASLAGIRVNRVLFSVYTVGGLILAIAGWITIGRVNAASPNVIPDANLDSITAVVIGGTSLFGGRGTLIGTFIGAVLVGVVSNGLSLAGLDQAYKILAIGILVITAVALDQWIRKVRS